MTSATTTMGAQMTDPDDDLAGAWTVRKVADVLGTNPARVRRWLKAGMFPGAFKTTDTQQAQWLIPRSSVEAWRNRGHIRGG